MQDLKFHSFIVFIKQQKHIYVLHKIAQMIIFLQNKEG